MGQSADLFLRMTEEEYFKVPLEVREKHLHAKIYSQSINDFDELMKDETYSRLYKEQKTVKKQLEQRAYDLREAKRSGK